MALIDTHCHLDYGDFDADRAQVVARAKDAGVVAIVNPGTNLDSSRKALALADAFDSVYAAVGVHPNDAKDWDAHTLDELRELASHPKVVAIGEIGLDYYRDWTPPEKQRTIFEAQLQLAAELSLPVIVHNRQAIRDVMKFLLAWRADLEAADSALAKRPGVLHSYGEDVEVAQEAIAHHFFIGFTGPITFTNAPELQQVAAQLPLEKLLVETDSPYLSPHPQRGQRNEPGRVKLIAEKLAELHNRAFDALAEMTTANARMLFALGAAP